MARLLLDGAEYSKTVRVLMWSRDVVIQHLVAMSSVVRSARQGRSMPRVLLFQKDWLILLE